MALRIRLFGRFAVLRDGEEIPPAAFAGRLVRTLIRVLVTQRGRFVSKDALVEALWPRRPPRDPSRNIEILVVRARRALGDHAFILTGPGGYAFTEDHRCRVDVEDFLARLGEGRRKLALRRAAAALGAFEDALECWGGDPLAEDAYSEWAQEYRREMARAYLECLEGGAAAALAAGDPVRASALAEHAIARDPLREPAHLLLIHALAASGDQAGALSAFDALRAQLVDELGLDPSPEAWDLQKRILRGEPLRPVAPSPVKSSPAASEELAFVGREAEVEAILAMLAGPSRILLLSGRAGAGKSRLLAEAAARSSVPVLSTRAFLAQREHPWSLARSILREALNIDVDSASAVADHTARALADVLPELAEARETPELAVEAETRRALALEGALALLQAVAQPSILLLVDDLQWADPSSLDLLHLVTERGGEIGVVLAYRPEEVPRLGPVDSFLGSVGRLVGVHTLKLPSLPREAITTLVGERQVAEAIARGTDGTPLAVAEVLRSLEREGAVRRLADGTWRPTSPQSRALARRAAVAGQRRAIQVRVSTLPPEARTTLELLALSGRQIPARTLARARDVSQSAVIAALDVLFRAGLATPGERGWITAHDLIGESVTESLPTYDAIRLHAMLDEALRREGADPAEVALHVAAAGDAAAAVTLYADGAHAALERFANDEAIRLAEAALALRPDPAMYAALLETRAQARARRGDFAGAREDFRGVLARRPHGPERSRALARLAFLEAGSQDYLRAADLADLATREAGGDRRSRANALTIRAIIDMNLGDLESCLARTAEALTLFEAEGDAKGLVMVLDTRAITTFEEGRIPEAVKLFDRVAALCLDSGDLLRAITPKATRAFALSLMGRAEEGISDADEALRLARLLGHPDGQSYALWQRAQVLVALTRFPQALRDADEALAIAELLGHREWIAASLYARGRRCGGWTTPVRPRPPSSGHSTSQTACRSTHPTPAERSSLSCWRRAGCTRPRR